MAWRENVLEYAYVCDNCGAVVPVASDRQADMPTGYHVHLRRVTAAHKHSVTPAMFLCSKECLINWTQFGISASTTLVDPETMR